MLYVFLAVLGVVLLAVGIYLPRTGKDVIAERLAAFNHRARSLEEIELQQPFSERVVRPFIRQLADAMGRFQQARSKNPKEGQVKGLAAIQAKLALAGNPYPWTPADYLGMKAFPVLGALPARRGGRQALKSVEMLTTVAGRNRFVRAIPQAEVRGENAQNMLRVQGQRIRALWRQHAEEKAAQLQLKLIFPLAIFI